MFTEEMNLTDFSIIHIFLESTKLIKKRLSNNMRLNIHETLGLFFAYITTSLNEGKTIFEIQKHIPELLSPNQVMIGVPESLRKLNFEIKIFLRNLYLKL